MFSLYSFTDTVTDKIIFKRKERNEADSFLLKYVFIMHATGKNENEYFFLNNSSSSSSYKHQRDLMQGKELFYPDVLHYSCYPKYV